MFGIARFAFISALTFALGACGGQSDDASCAIWRCGGGGACCTG